MCKKLRAKPMGQLMADLPTTRLEETAPFERCGIDVFGPFLVKHGRATRAKPGSRKIWALIFCCLYSCAIHLETLDQMDIASFKMALTRFESLRGPCNYLRSDAGSNFMGARNLEEKHEADRFLSDARNEYTSTGRIWEVNPPLASHFGGVWERAIRSVRKVIDAVLMYLGMKLLTDEELRTLLAEAVRIVNSTPLWAASDSPDEPLPLSPSHLLNPREATSILPIEQEEERDSAAYGSNRWKKMNSLKDRFWEEWNKFYLFERPFLRSKWWKKQPNARVGDIVLMKEKSRNRLEWNEGVVTEVTTDKDGLVRKVMVRPIKRDDKSTTSQIRERAIHDLILLQRPGEMGDGDGEMEEDIDPVEPQDPLSCNSLATCPKCDLDITTGGLNGCHNIHKSVYPFSYVSQKGKISNKFKSIHRIESDAEADKRINNLISNCPNNLKDDPEQVNSTPSLIALGSGVTIL